MKILFFDQLSAFRWVDVVLLFHFLFCVSAVVHDITHMVLTRSQARRMAAAVPPANATDVLPSVEFLCNPALAQFLNATFSSNNTADAYEFRGSQWIVYHPQTILDQYQLHQKYNPECLSVDFASLYHGMGHYVVCSVYAPTGAIYYRLDGGSDGHSAEANMRWAAHLLHVPDSKSFSFSHWLHAVDTGVCVVTS